MLIDLNQNRGLLGTCAKNAQVQQCANFAHCPASPPHLWAKQNLAMKPGLMNISVSDVSLEEFVDRMRMYCYTTNNLSTSLR
jgi:hypothetical protein